MLFNLKGVAIKLCTSCPKGLKNYQRRQPDRQTDRQIKQYSVVHSIIKICARYVHTLGSTGEILIVLCFSKLSHPNKWHQHTCIRLKPDSDLNYTSSHSDIAHTNSISLFSFSTFALSLLTWISCLHTTSGLYALNIKILIFCGSLFVLSIQTSFHQATKVIFLNYKSDCAFPLN